MSHLFGCRKLLLNASLSLAAATCTYRSYQRRQRPWPQSSYWETLKNVSKLSPFDGIGCACCLPVLCKELSSQESERSINEETHDGDPLEASSREATALYQEVNELSELQIFSGSGNLNLANEICNYLGISLGRVYTGRFADGEIDLKVLDEVRGRDVFILQSSPPASSGEDIHSAIFELMFLVSALRRSSAKRINVVLPYMSYLRQVRYFPDDEVGARPLAAADITLMLETCGVNRVIFVDLHSQRTEAFFNEILPVTTIQTYAIAVEYFRKLKLRKPVVVATENTGAERAKAFWTQLQKANVPAGLATLISTRPERIQREGSPNPPSPTGELPMRLVGDVEGCDCIIVDDIIDTGERAVNTARALKAAGGGRVFMYATHGVLSKGAVERLNASPLHEIAVTNTVSIPPNVCCEKLKVISIGRLLGETIRRIHHNIGASSLYRDGDVDRFVVAERYKH